MFMRPRAASTGHVIVKHRLFLRCEYTTLLSCVFCFLASVSFLRSGVMVFFSGKRCS